MSTVLLGETWPLEMPPTAKSVAISLADQANDTGVCWPAVGSISIRTNLDERTVRRAIHYLESNHYLRVERRTGHSSYYHLTPSQYSQPVTPVTESPLSQSQVVLTERPGSPVIQSPTPVTAPYITINNHQRTIKEPIGQQADRFPEFWQAYPKKVKKKEAHKVWKSKRLDAHADRLIEDVRDRLNEDGRWIGGFVPDPPTYLRGERWNDEFTEVKR